MNESEHIFVGCESCGVKYAGEIADWVCPVCDSEHKSKTDIAGLSVDIIDNVEYDPVEDRYHLKIGP